MTILQSILVMEKEIQIFFNCTNNILEADYGDYMRQANFHLNNLKEEMERLPYEDVLNQVIASQQHLLYESNGEISQTHQRLVKDIEVAEQLLAAHKQDWESKVPTFRDQPQALKKSETRRFQTYTNSDL